MQRRNFIHRLSTVGAVCLGPVRNVVRGLGGTGDGRGKGVGDDRVYWAMLMEKIAHPILSPLSKGELRKNMEVQVSPVWDGRDICVAYLEAVGRLLAGMAPWFALPDDETAEGKVRKRLREEALLGIAAGADPHSPDYFCWGTPTARQPLVDASYLAYAFLRAPKALWEPLSVSTKQQVVHAFKGLRNIDPYRSNWLLFAAMVETFLLSIGEDIDAARIDNAIDTMNKWYVGDGWYSDGERFHFDHYNGYVIHPMMVDVLKVNVAAGRRKKEEYQLAYRRMQRYAEFQERYISPEGTYPVFGRSSTYRVGAFQPLAQLALEDSLPKGIHPAQVRCALTAVMKRIFIPSTFTPKGYLQLGLVGDEQQGIADNYTNTGSLYLTSLAFLPLGLPATHAFWAGQDEAWTSVKAWGGKPFKKDYAVDY